MGATVKPKAEFSHVISKNRTGHNTYKAHLYTVLDLPS